MSTALILLLMLESGNKTQFLWRAVTWKGLRIKQISHWIYSEDATALEFQKSNLDSPVSIKASLLLICSLLVGTCNGKLKYLATPCHMLPV